MIEQLSSFLQILILHMPQAFAFMAVLWGIHAINMILGYRLRVLGIIPRFWPSLITGPIFSPLIHADVNHLMHNSLPLFVLVSMLFSYGPPYAMCIIISTAYLSGILTWLFGRRACHIGSSSLVMALMGYFCYQGYMNPSITSLAIVLVLLYYFGSLLLSFIPTDERVSYEGHFLGLVSGIIIGHFGCIRIFEPIALYFAKLL